MDYIIRYAHFLSLMVLFASLVAEHLLTARTITGRQARTLARLDLIYGIAALVVLSTGALLFSGFGFGKGANYYLTNGLFHAKVTLFVVVGLLSIKSTLFFLRHRRADDAATIEVPRSIILFQRVQLFIVMVLPLFGLLIARGIGAHR